MHSGQQHYWPLVVLLDDRLVRTVFFGCPFRLSFVLFSLRRISEAFLPNTIAIMSIRNAEKIWDRFFPLSVVGCINAKQLRGKVLNIVSCTAQQDLSARAARAAFQNLNFVHFS